MEAKKTKCKYIYTENYNPVYVNGAYGGVNPRGEIIINFFFERYALPESQSFILNNSLQEKEIPDEREPKYHSDNIIRSVQNGIILNYNDAKEIHRWLGEHIKQMESND